jgi:hypothetical protein
LSIISVNRGHVFHIIKLMWSFHHLREVHDLIRLILPIRLLHRLSVMRLRQYEAASRLKAHRLRQVNHTRGIHVIAAALDLFLVHRWIIGCRSNLREVHVLILLLRAIRLLLRLRVMINRQFGAVSRFRGLWQLLLGL